MKIPEMVLVAIEVGDILNRADAVYVPHSTIVRHCDAAPECLRTVLYRMVRAGFLRGRQGRAGGYMVARNFTLADCYKLLTPSAFSEDKTCNERVNTIIRRFSDSAETCLVGRVKMEIQRSE